MIMNLLNHPSYQEESQRVKIFKRPYAKSIMSNFSHQSRKKNLLKQEKMPIESSLS